MIKSRRMRQTGHVALMGRRGKRIDYCWESDRKETTRRTKTWVDNIKMDLVKIGWAGVD
jgi:hypothetical protein